MFVHAGFGHIFANMFTLYFFGRALLGLVGQGRFLIIYFVGGLLASICYIVFTLMGGILGIAFLGSPFIPVVGASGAVFAGLLIHIFMASIATGELPALISMFTGTVSKEYAEHYHKLWYDEVKGERPLGLGPACLEDSK